MNVVLVHNHYQQPGGEDEVFAAEADLLESRGNKVTRYTVHNDAVGTMGRVELAKATVWNGAQYAELRRLIRAVGAEVVHVHNTLPIISPAVYYAARAEGSAVVQSLHNPRLLCPAATFYRNGKLCTTCLGKGVAWPGVLHACYRGSALQSLGVASMVALHRLIGTWSRMVDRYIVFTQFYRDIFVQGGLPPQKIVVKPHFVDPDPGREGRAHGRYALYVGRLDPEKGVASMLQAWRRLKLDGVHVPLKVRGDGQLYDVMRAVTEREALDIEFVRRLSRAELNDLMRNASFLVWPSEGFYETFGLVAVEAFACGVPVIASSMGVATTIVADGYTGLHFRSGDAGDMAAKVAWAVRHPAGMSAFGKAARKEYERAYTADVNYPQLIAIYREALNSIVPGA